MLCELGLPIARYGLSKWPIAIRHGLFGVFLGAVPGIGGAVVDWLSYAMGIFFTKDKSGFGAGSTACCSRRPRRTRKRRGRRYPRSRSACRAGGRGRS